MACELFGCYSKYLFINNEEKWINDESINNIKKEEIDLESLYSIIRN